MEEKNHFFSFSLHPLFFLLCLFLPFLALPAPVCLSFRHPPAFGAAAAPKNPTTTSFPVLCARLFYYLVLPPFPTPTPKHIFLPFGDPPPFFSLFCFVFALWL